MTTNDSKNPHNSTERAGESGNVMFWIFVSVVLFAALSMAVANISRSGGDIHKELRTTYATNIIQFADTAKKAIQVMRIDGVEVTQISFENTFSSADYTNAACATSDCRVFHTQGGGVSYHKPEDKWLDTAFIGESDYGYWFFPDDICIQDYPATDGGNCTGDDDKVDLVIMLQYVKKELCMSLNDTMGITNPGDDAPVNAGCHGDSEFTGSFNEEMRISNAALDGKASGCFKQTGACGAGAGNYYVYYKALVGR